MVRFGDALHRAAQGEAVEPITFRDGDYWHEMAEDLNTMLARCRPSGQAGPAKERITEKSESDTEESAELVSA